MPVTIDITKDLRYQQRKTEGVKESTLTIAEKLLNSGLNISFIQNVTNLSKDKLEKMLNRLRNEKS